MIKRICLFLGIVIGMGLLVGCTQEKENYSNTLTIGIIEESPYMDEYLEAFNQRYPNCEVIIKDYRRYEDGVTMQDIVQDMMLDVVSGNGPDVVSWGYSYAPEYVRVMGINEASIFVFNESGQYSGEIDTTNYSLIDAIGRCADGNVYVALADKEIGEDKIWGGAIARLDGKNNSLTILDISGIVSERGSFGCIGSTFNSDFVIFGPTYDEIYLSNYNEKISVADTKISTYVSNGLAMSRNIILDDGRLLSVKGWLGGYDENGDTIYKKDGIEFYYIPVEAETSPEESVIYTEMMQGEMYTGEDSRVEPQKDAETRKIFAATLRNLLNNSI